MAPDPAPHLDGPEAAFDALIQWGEEYRLLMAKRDPLVKGALLGPLTGHGGITNAQRATGLTRQTLYRARDREEIPVLDQDHNDDLDWDEYADYLDTLADDIDASLARIPRPQGTGRTFTSDDLRAGLLRKVAERVRATEWTDLGYWALTMELRQQAADSTRPTAVLQEDWRETDDSRTQRETLAQVLGEVADQITRYRTEGPSAAGFLDPDTLTRARSDRRPPSSRAMAQPDGDGPDREADR
ncbi:hypothetical protein ACFVT5_41480 [Streptomyces sp. NPDC058001]|uniref:hypothetical protein n=1 Tax=Streptomyces sp. NPDC058001 TaxID=3346300 RepID=UPI0036E337AB